MEIYKSTGRLECICGSMFSGKTEEFIRRIRRGIFAQKIVQIFKHSSDNRYSSSFVHSHNGEKIRAIPVSSSKMISEFILDEAEIIGIDEAQFFDMNIITLIDSLIRKGKRVIIAGLDLDFRGIPFGPMPYLLALSDEVIKLKAVCMKSGKDAHFSQRIINGKPASYKDPIVLIGETDYYEARARDFFDIDEIPLEEYLKNK
jgi:thymidine kinase